MRLLGRPSSLNDLCAEGLNEIDACEGGFYVDSVLRQSEEDAFLFDDSVQVEGESK
jgi:hypothetical protein